MVPVNFAFASSRFDDDDDDDDDEPLDLSIKTKNFQANSEISIPRRPEEPINITPQLPTGIGITCSTCQYRTNSTTTFKHHVATHTGAKDRSCGACGMRFNHRTTVLNHIRHHCTKAKSNGLAQETIASFRPRGSFTKMHLTRTAREVGYSLKCPSAGCMEVFGTTGQLNRHELIHGKEWKCKFCQAGFQTRQGLTFHLKKFHSEEHKFSYRCTKCPFSFSRWLILRKHYQDAHEWFYPPDISFYYNSVRENNQTIENFNHLGPVGVEQGQQNENRLNGRKRETDAENNLKPVGDGIEAQNVSNLFGNDNFTFVPPPMEIEEDVVTNSEAENSLDSEDDNTNGGNFPERTLHPFLYSNSTVSHVENVRPPPPGPKDVQKNLKPVGDGVETQNYAPQTPQNFSRLFANVKVGENNQIEKDVQNLNQNLSPVGVEIQGQQDENNLNGRTSDKDVQKNLKPVGDGVEAQNVTNMFGNDNFTFVPLPMETDKDVETNSEARNCLKTQGQQDENNLNGRTSDKDVQTNLKPVGGAVETQSYGAQDVSMFGNENFVFVPSPMETGEDGTTYSEARNRFDSEDNTNCGNFPKRTLQPFLLSKSTVSRVENDLPSAAPLNFTSLITNTSSNQNRENRNTPANFQIPATVTSASSNSSAKMQMPQLQPQPFNNFANLSNIYQIYQPLQNPDMQQVIDYLWMLEFQKCFHVIQQQKQPGNTPEKKKIKSRNTKDLSKPVAIVCPECKEEFSMRCKLQLHSKIHGTAHICPHCQAGYGAMNGLWNHLNKSHPDKIQRNFRCKLCPTTFNSRNRLMTHLKNCHEINPKFQLSSVNLEHQKERFIQEGRTE